MTFIVVGVMGLFCDYVRTTIILLAVLGTFIPDSDGHPRRGVQETGIFSLLMIDRATLEQSASESI
jgi:hypothetical protein